MTKKKTKIFGQNKMYTSKTFDKFLNVYKKIAQKCEKFSKNCQNKI